MLQRVFLFIFCVFLLSTFSYSQKLALELKNYTRKDGLPSNETYYILRDSKNYLWIATDQGVVRFNGVEMKIFELEDNVIFKIKEDEKGRVWFFTSSGKLSYYFNGVIYNYKYNNNILKEIKNLIISDANVFDDEILMNSINGINYKISKEGKISLSEYRKEDNFAFPFVINVTKQKDILFAEKIYGKERSHEFLNIKLNGSDTMSYKIPFGQISFSHYGVINDEKILYFFNNNLLVKLYLNGTYIIKEMPSNILGISMGAQNNIWVGLSKNGAISLSKELGEMEHILPDYSVSSIATDYEGGTWFSTLEKGVFYFNNSGRKRYAGKSNLDQFIFRTFSINDSNFLFANHEGVFKMKVDNILPILSSKMQIVSSLFIYDGKIFAGGIMDNRFVQSSDEYGRVFSVGDKLYKQLYFLTTSSPLYETADNDFLIEIGMNFYRFDINSSKNKNLTNTFRFMGKGVRLEKGKLFSDNKRQFWFSTFNSLLKFSDSLNSARRFNEKERLFKKGVTNMSQMDNGLYAIGIRFGGLAIMKDSTVIENITELNGLSSNSIKYILPHKNYLWVATAKGISIVYFTSFSPLKYKVINVANGKDFADIIVNQLSYLGKDVLAATNNGIYRFNDSLIIAESNIVKPLPFYINTIRYNNIDTTGITSLSVPYHSARISIGFSAISFANGDEIEYRYRIANNDTTWSYIKNPELLLENLSPGDYNVQIQALIKYQDRYSEIRELNITVEKPWWQNNWFRLLVGLLLLLCGYAFYQSRIKKINATAKKELDTKSKFLELEQTALRAQMNPHFIFNCLSSIQQLIVTGESEKANEYLVKFSRLMRLTLELSASPYNSIADEVTYLSEYISLEQLRFPNQFDFSFDINSEIDKNNIAIPNMMIQPIVENAINHGIKYVKNRQGFISISLVVENDMLVCTIRDNGVGRNMNKALLDDYKTHKSFGMDIITKRLVTFNTKGESKYKMEVIDLKNQHNEPVGTEVILHLPIKKLL
jgi:ligand-binding sensor domain-containing protein